MSFHTMLDEITLKSLMEEQFECFIEYYRENYSEDYKSDLENLMEVYKMMNGGVEYPRTQNASPSKIKEPYEPSPRMYSIAKSQPKRTYNEDLECEIVMVKMPKCMAWLDDKPIGDMEDKVDNPSPQSTPQVLLSIEVYTPPVTHPGEVEETIGILMEVGPSDHMKLEDLGLNTNTRDIFLSSKGFPSVDEPEPQLLPNFSLLDVNLGDKRGTDPPINPYSPGSFRMKEITNGNLRTRIFEEKKKNSLQTLETASGLILTQSPGLPQENLIFNSVSWIGMNRKAYLLEDKQIPSVEVIFDEKKLGSS
ncbi:hypothetical protein Tco_0405321 [Tanacetum coccineum]